MTASAGKQWPRMKLCESGIERLISFLVFQSLYQLLPQFWKACLVFLIQLCNCPRSQFLHVDLAGVGWGHKDSDQLQVFPSECYHKRCGAVLHFSICDISEAEHVIDHLEISIIGEIPKQLPVIWMMIKSDLRLFMFGTQTMRLTFFIWVEPILLSNGSHCYRQKTPKMGFAADARPCLCLWPHSCDRFPSMTENVCQWFIIWWHIYN